MSSKKTYYNSGWEKTFPWIKPASKKTAFTCTLCASEINLSNKGVEAIKSHANGKKHNAKLPTQVSSSACTLTSFLQPTSSKTSLASAACTAIIPTENDNQNEQPPEPVTNSIPLLNSRDVMDACILWSIHTVMTHRSANSNEKLGSLFCRMFHDSAIAGKFSCGKTKTTYLLNHGLAPHFKNLVNTMIEKQFFVIIFDESLNKTLQQEQMDVYIRFWNNENDSVETRFLSSFMLGHTKSDNLLEALNEVTSNLDPSLFVQLGMDGPSVNSKLFSDLNEDRQDRGLSPLIDIGSCSLHTVHNAFTNGAKAVWDIPDILNALHWLFHNCPARQADFKTSSGQNLLPLPFCATRWIEDEPVAQRALDLWPHIKTYIEGIQALPRYKRPKCKSYDVVKSAVNDKFFPAKLSFFISIASELKVYLTAYQTDHPVLPFMARDLKALLKSLMSRIIKPEVMKAATSTKSLLKVSAEPISENLKESQSTDPGFATLSEIPQASSSVEKSTFLQEVARFVAAAVRTLQEKSPLKYKLFTDISCLDPRQMIKDENGKEVKTFRCVLLELVQRKILKPNVCDTALREFEEMVSHISKHHKEDCMTFNTKTDRLDHFFSKVFSGMLKERETVFKVIKLLLILSHGQATIERGFSVNKRAVQMGMESESLVSRRIIYDFVMKLGGDATDVVITREMRDECQKARGRYQLSLERKREESKEKKRNDLKRVMKEELKALKVKKSRLERDVDQFEEEADKLALNGERKSNWTDIARSNALRKKIKEHRQSIQECDENLIQKEKELKNA